MFISQIVLNCDYSITMPEAQGEKTLYDCLTSLLISAKKKEEKKSVQKLNMNHFKEIPSEQHQLLIQGNLCLGEVSQVGHHQQVVNVGIEHVLEVLG